MRILQCSFLLSDTVFPSANLSDPQQPLVLKLKYVPEGFAHCVTAT